MAMDPTVLPATCRLRCWPVPDYRVSASLMLCFKRTKLEIATWNGRSNENMREETSYESEGLEAKHPVVWHISHCKKLMASVRKSEALSASLKHFSSTVQKKKKTLG